MKTSFNHSTDKFETNNFEVLNEKEMDQLKGGFTPKDKDVFDPDEH
jgi:hypothetical protein